MGSWHSGDESSNISHPTVSSGNCSIYRFPIIAFWLILWHFILGMCSWANSRSSFDAPADSWSFSTEHLYFWCCAPQTKAATGLPQSDFNVFSKETAIFPWFLPSCTWSGKWFRQNLIWPMDLYQPTQNVCQSKWEILGGGGLNIKIERKKKI